MSNPATRDPGHFRALARQAVSLPGMLRGLDAAAGWQREGKLIDLSLGGACLELAEAPAEGTALELVIDTPQLWDPLTLVAAVRWARALPEQEYPRLLLGLRFEHVNGASVRALIALLEAEAFG